MQTLVRFLTRGTNLSKIPLWKLAEGGRTGAHSFGWIDRGRAVACRTAECRGCARPGRTLRSGPLRAPAERPMSISISNIPVRGWAVWLLALPVLASGVASRIPCGVA